MKVLIVHSVYKFQGGEEAVVAEEAKLLRSQGLNVQVLWFNNEEKRLLKLFLLPFNVFSYLKMRRTLKKYQPDIVHIHNLHFAASPSVLYAIKASGIPVVMTLHNYRMVCPSGMLYADGKLFLDSLRQQFPITAIRKGVYKNWLVTFWVVLTMQLHKWLMTWKIVNRFIVLTDHARDILLQSSLNLAAARVIVKPNFSSQLSSPAVTRQPFFLYVGRLSTEKGIDVLLKAFSLGSHQLKIAGDGPMKPEVTSAANENSNIEYLGKLNKQQVSELMRSATALVFPSIWYEGMPLTIIEAFSAGTAVIASRLGAMADMVKHKYNGLHFTAGDPTALATALDTWTSLPDNEKYNFSRQASSTYHEHYTPEHNLDQLLRIYQSVNHSFPVIKASASHSLPGLKDRA